eukprot:15202-Heterococcus_DN1.PRE.3
MLLLAACNSHTQLQHWYMRRMEVTARGYGGYTSRWAVVMCQLDRINASTGVTRSAPPTAALAVAAAAACALHTALILIIDYILAIARIRARGPTQACNDIIYYA